MERDLSQAYYEMCKRELGTKCRICGAENVEYHHIIPLNKGGTNDISNIIPLCHEHHCIVHGVQSRIGRNYSHHGRNRTVKKIPGYKHILTQYVECKIGSKLCRHILGMGGASKIQDAVWFKEFLKEKGIVEQKNYVDVVEKNGTLEAGRMVGYAKFADGSEKQYFWEET